MSVRMLDGKRSEPHEFEDGRPPNMQWVDEQHILRYYKDVFRVCKLSIPLYHVYMYKMEICLFVLWFQVVVRGDEP